MSGKCQVSVMVGLMGYESGTFVLAFVAHYTGLWQFVFDPHGSIKVKFEIWEMCWILIMVEKQIPV